MTMQNGNGNGGNAIQKIDQRQATLKDLLTRALPSMKHVLPRHLTPERLVKVALAATGRTPKLLECTPASVLECVMQAAQLGLEPGGPLGHAYLVPYGNTCTLIVGYRGLIDLARRSGEIESIEARVVFERDEFRVAYGLNPVLEHVPNLMSDPGQMIMVYGIARLRGGGVQAEVMTRSQVEGIRRRSKSGSRSDSPWATDYDEMARKTVVRRLCKYLPLSVELADVIEGEAKHEGDVGASGGLLSPASGRSLEAPASNGNGASAEPESQGDAGQNQDADPPEQQPGAQASSTPPVQAAQQPVVDHAARIRAATTIRELNAAAADASKSASGEALITLSKLVDECRAALQRGSQS
jgi:recombination protein RecT